MHPVLIQFVIAQTPLLKGITQMECISPDELAFIAQENKGVKAKEMQPESTESMKWITLSKWVQ